MSKIHCYEQTVKIDGVCITSTRWSILGNMQIQFSKAPTIKTVKSKDYKGLKCFSGMRTCATLDMCEFTTCGNELAIKLLFTSSKLLPSSSLEEIKQYFIQAVDEVFESLGDNGITKSYIKSKCCWYNAYVSSRTCEDCITKLPPGIATGELTEFGKKFNAVMKTKLVGWNCSMSLLVCSFGQSEEIDMVCKRLERLNLHQAEQVILHIAIDYKQPNKCLLWNLNKLVLRNFPNDYKTSRKTTYQPLFISGHGNYTVNCKEPKIQYMNSDVELVYIQLYTDTFKEFHREAEPAWKTPKSVRSLTQLTTCAGNLSHWNSSPEWIQRRLFVLRRYCTNLRGATCNVARFEVVLSVSHPKHAGLNTTIKVLQAIIDRHTGISEEQFVCDYLDAFDYSKLTGQIDKTILVAANTLEKILANSMAERKAKKLLASIPHIGDIMTASVCEMILGYGIYGTLNNTNGPYFDTLLMREIGLTGSKLDPRDDINIVQEDDVFVGMKTIRNVELTESNECPCLKYVGRLNVRKLFCRYLFPELSIFEVENIDRLFIEACNGKTHGLPEMIWFLVSKHSDDTFFCNSTPLEISPFKLIEKAKSETGHILFQDPLMFVKRLFSLYESQSQLGLTYIIREIQLQLHPETTAELIVSTARHIDCNLYRRNMLGLLYPWNIHRRSLSFVLPLLGDSQDSFMKTSLEGMLTNIQEKQFHIINLYNFAFSRVSESRGFIFGKLYDKLVEISGYAQNGNGYDSNCSLTSVFQYISREQA